MPALSEAHRENGQHGPDADQLTVPTSSRRPALPPSKAGAVQWRNGQEANSRALDLAFGRQMPPRRSHRDDLSRDSLVVPLALALAPRRPQ